VWCAQWFVLHGDRNCCCVLPSIRVVDPFSGGGDEFVPYSRVWCEVDVVARDFKRGLRLKGGSARLPGGCGTRPSLCRMFVGVEGVYGVLVVLC